MRQARLPSENQVSMQRIQAFRQRFGDGHYYLACHAAVPATLTPDLLYQLWVNFQYSPYSTDIPIPWIAVSDFLLSGLCEEVGYELYEIAPSARNQLLQYFKQNERLGTRRLRDIANFLLTYTDTYLYRPEEDIRDLAQVQRWQALVYIEPDRAASEIAGKLSQLSATPDQSGENGSIEWVRMASVVKSINVDIESSEFKVLSTYLNGMAAFVHRDWQCAQNNFSKIASSGQKIVQVSRIALAIPAISEDLLLKQSTLFSKLSEALSNTNLRRTFFTKFIIGVVFAFVIGVIFGNRNFSDSTLRLVTLLPGIINCFIYIQSLFKAGKYIPFYSPWKVTIFWFWLLLEFLTPSLLFVGVLFVFPPKSVDLGLVAKSVTFGLGFPILLNANLPLFLDGRTLSLKSLYESYAVRVREEIQDYYRSENVVFWLAFRRNLVELSIEEYIKGLNFLEAYYQDIRDETERRDTIIRLQNLRGKIQTRNWMRQMDRSRIAQEICVLVKDTVEKKSLKMLMRELECRDVIREYFPGIQLQPRLPNHRQRGSLEK